MRWVPPRSPEAGAGHAGRWQGKVWRLGAEVQPAKRRKVPQEDALVQDWGFLRGLQLEMVKVRNKKDCSG